MSSVGSISTPTINVGADGSVTAGNLVNNLDTTSIINALMAAASVPQVQLEARIKTEQTTVTDYQNLNQSLQALQSSASLDAKANGLNLLTVASSNTSVTATADTSASATSFSLQVDQVAQQQVSVSGPLTTWPDTSGAITIVRANGTATQVQAASASISDVVSAINTAGAGVTASQVAVGTDASGNPQYRLQLTSSQPGANGAFQLFAGTSAQQSVGTATDILAQPGAATVQSAQDAQVTLWPGTAAAQVVTSSSNTFSNLEQGVSVTVTAPTTSPVTLTSSIDSTHIESAASTVVSAVNTILSYIAQQTAGTTTTNSDGSTSITAGPFTGSSTVRDLAQQLTTAVVNPVGAGGNISPSTYGISIQSDGTIAFDQTTFAAALAADPTGTIAAVQQIAARVSTVASTASDPVTGTLTTSIQSQQSQIKTDQASDTNWTKVLANEKTQLQTQYASLVNTLSQLQSEQSYLTQQINAMNPQSSTGG
jgi:flagellar hook-associated protein 2